MNIRPVGASDLPGIRAIYNHFVRTSTATFDETESDDAFWAAKAERIRAAGLPFLVAENDAGEPLGYALAQPWSPKTAYRRTVENSIYLAPNFAGQGYGRALMAEFLDACRSAGIREVIAVIVEDGAASLALHRRAGFSDVGRLKNVGVKFGRDLDVVFLQKSLTPPE
jgi:L-amino acid N-acyltransferase YncA